MPAATVMFGCDSFLRRTRRPKGAFVVTHRIHVVTFLVVLVFAALAQAQTFTTLYNFTGGSAGEYPAAGMVRDSAGNLYGTTAGNYSSNCGTVFEVTSSGTEVVLHSFTGSDGCNPYGPVVRDSAGNLYGTTYYGGSSYRGVVFKIDTTGTETVLHSFTGGITDGYSPGGGLARDKAGNLYGMTNQGGAFDLGTVYKLSTTSSFTLLYSFRGGANGQYPTYSQPMLDKMGNIYGVASGGTSGYGVVFELTTSGTFRVLHSFAGGSTDGCYCYASPKRDKNGNIYGTTNGCGSAGEGTIWKLTAKRSYTLLHSFAGGDGSGPGGGVVLDSTGNLYGSTEAGGASNYGTLYQLSSSGTLTLLHSFSYSDGSYPFGELWRDSTGGLYGITSSGGSNGLGTVWQYK